MVSTEAFILQNPDMSNTQYLSWVKSMQVAEREPEVTDLGFDAIVRPGQLPQFIARVLADPPQPLPPGFTYQVTPPGKRPFYCLTRFTYSHGGPLLPLDYDVCSTKTTKLEEGLALSGDGYVPYKIGNTEYLAVITPVYPGGVVPPTLQAHRLRHRRGRSDHHPELRPPAGAERTAGDRNRLPLPHR